MEVLCGVQASLKIYRPVGWLEELSKLENMELARGIPDLLGAESWQVKMRILNRDTVLPRQVGLKKKSCNAK